jgi:hypothetical protein
LLYCETRTHVAQEDFEHSDDDFVADTSNVVVFSDQATNHKTDRVSKAQMKAFMVSAPRFRNIIANSKEVIESSQDNFRHHNSYAYRGRRRKRGRKVKIVPLLYSLSRRKIRTNAQNDALLHRLIHTQLLSGSLNPELNLTSAQRKKAFAGRVLELAGAAKLGKGEKVVIEAERRKAAKSVREGLASKQKEREKQRLEEVG